MAQVDAMEKEEEDVQSKSAMSAAPRRPAQVIRKSNVLVEEAFLWWFLVISQQNCGSHERKRRRNRKKNERKLGHRWFRLTNHSAQLPPTAFSIPFLCATKREAVEMDSFSTFLFSFLKCFLSVIIMDKLNLLWAWSVQCSFKIISVFYNPLSKIQLNSFFYSF